MSKLIALVAIAAMADGKRIAFEPAAEVTGLSKHDVAELKRIGALRDEDEAAAADKLAAGAEAKAGKEFSAARKAVQASQAAIEAKPA